MQGRNNVDSATSGGMAQIAAAPFGRIGIRRKIAFHQSAKVPSDDACVGQLLRCVLA
jgi:hypothetical protein